MALDEKINQALHTLRVMEAAVHGVGTWLMRSGEFYAPVRIEVGENEVTFVAHLEQTQDEVVLLLDGEAVLATTGAPEMVPGKALAWHVGLPDSAPVG